MRHWYRNLDFPVLLVWVALCVCGLVAIYSSTHGEAQEYLKDSVQNNFDKQLMWLGISAVALITILLIPIRLLVRLTPLIYLATLGLLIAALVFGREINGARSWIHLGPFSLQSSELAKVGALLMSAFVLASRMKDGNTMRVALMVIGVLALPVSLIALQNDLGTALVFVSLCPILWLCSGVPLRIVGLIIAAPITGYLAILNWQTALGFAGALGMIAWFATRDYKWVIAGVFVCAATVGATTFALESENTILKPYHIARIASFSNPEAGEYQAGVGFHQVQSKAALGSGGWLGQGFRQGSQTQGRYIPEQSTDFVFSVVGEEWGFAGGILILLLFAALLLRLNLLAKRIDHPFGSLVAAGAAGIFLIHVFVNLGMVLGLLPVIGIPLPFFSYGGSALLTNSILLGLALVVYMRRAEFSLYV